MVTGLETVSNKVPDVPGIYYIVKLSGGSISVVYIDKSGTMQRDGTFDTQGLRSRIMTRPNGESRQAYFESKFIEENIEALDIYWYVTMDKTVQDIPGYAEGCLLQQHFDVYGKLPPWNSYF